MYSDNDAVLDGGFPHSDTSGSKLVWQLPEAFAAFYVLLRLLSPRHSPYTPKKLLCRLPYKILLFSFSRPELVRFQLPFLNFIMNSALSKGLNQYPSPEY